MVLLMFENSILTNVITVAKGIEILDIKQLLVVN